MENTSIYRIMLLFNFLIKKKYSKKELICEYKKLSINISENSICNYVKKLEQKNINVKKEKINNTTYYYIDTVNKSLFLTDENLKLLSDVKKFLYSQKNYKHIRSLMELFYGLAEFIEDEEIKEKFVDFGYFSTINWGLVEILEEHCASKDIIVVDYILPAGGNKLIEIHTDMLIMSNTSDRIYLYGILKDGYDFFQLPVERIYCVKKIVRTNVMFNRDAKMLTYVVSNEAYGKKGLIENEYILKQDKYYTTIQTPIVNEFRLAQRLLYFCPNLYYISDNKIKNLVKEKLEILKANYEKAIDK